MSQMKKEKKGISRKWEEAGGGGGRKEGIVGIVWVLGGGLV